MDYRILLQEENGAVRERYELSIGHIRSMGTEEMGLSYGCYFRRVSAFTRGIKRLVKQVEEIGLSGEDGLEGTSLTLEALQEEDYALYQDILPENYRENFANPGYAAEVLGDDYDQPLFFLYMEARVDIIYAFEMRLMDITILNELFPEVYNLSARAWEEGENASLEQLIKGSLYWFISDYTEVTVDWRTREGLDPTPSFGTDTVMKQDLTDLRYFYAYGEYISETEIRLASSMSSPPQEAIDQMVFTYTERSRKGSQVMGRSLKRKRTVVVGFQLGFERITRGAAEYFREVGLEFIYYRVVVESANRRASGRRGYYGTSPSERYGYDRRYDSAPCIGSAFKEGKLAVLRSAYETYQKEAAWCVGPILTEIFGEEGLAPENEKVALVLSAHQEALTLAYANKSRQIVNQYMLGDEISFTIIAFPKLEIGSDFETTFRETVRINILGYEEYRKTQQCVIQALGKVGYVLITGRGGNETSMKVALHPLGDREREINFENCVSDVNTPLGKVFTSPILKGTEGLLHVRNVHAGDYQFRNLRMVSKDDKVTEYSCGNFEEAEAVGDAGNGKGAGAAGNDKGIGDAHRQGQALVKQVTTRGYDWLPLGEFAISTNTTAYAMTRRFSIGNKLPIPITKKTGPHFTVSDTCYSFAEDSPTYSPDGREIVARDNEISLLERTDTFKVHFNYHTDATIPHSGLGDIKAVRADGSRIDIIRQGRFVLEGTEELNEALDGTNDGATGLDCE